MFVQQNNPNLASNQSAEERNPVFCSDFSFSFIAKEENVHVLKATSHYVI